MSFICYVFPTEFNAQLNVEKVSSAMLKAVSIFLQNNNAILDIKRFDCLSYPFREIAWQTDEEFTWRHHEIEEVIIKWKAEKNENFAECEVWNDYLSSAYVGVLEDFVEGSVPKDIEQKIQDLGFHWKFQCHSESTTDYKVTAVLATTLANLCKGIIMFDQMNQEEGILPLKPQDFLQLVLNEKF
jgi:hypothetical protein